MTTSITQLFEPQVLPAAVGVIYTMPITPASSLLKNGRVRLTNTTGAAVTATLYADVAANASSSANCFLAGVSIAANTSMELDLPVMKAGDTLRGLAGSAASITAHSMDGVLFS